MYEYLEKTIQDSPRVSIGSFFWMVDFWTFPPSRNKEKQLAQAGGENRDRGKDRPAWTQYIS